jgi:hypothetical protein
MATSDDKLPRLVQTVEGNTATATIKKPEEFNLDRFKSKSGPNATGVGTLLAALPVHSIAQAKDFVRLHDDIEAYWSSELCFVIVPTKGMKQGLIHLIDEAVAVESGLPTGRIQRFRLALATKPYDCFFFCQVPSVNLDNVWNLAAWNACDLARARWLQVTSRKAEGVENYRIDYARKETAFPAPKWPTQSLQALIGVTLEGRMITTHDHPGLLRLLGAPQEIT